MRLTRAGIALLIFLVVACPLLSLATYAGLTRTTIGPFRFGLTATATGSGLPVALPTATSVTGAAGGVSGTTTPRAIISNTTPTPIRNLGVVPLTPSAAASAAASVAPLPTATAVRPGASAAPATPLTVAYDTYAPYFPVRIAETEGYYKARNLAVKQVPFGLNGNDYNEEARRKALRDGTFDVLLTTLDSVALFGDDQTGKVVAIVDESAGADKIVARAPIARLNDLKGKRIAYSQGSVGEFYLYATLNLVGLKASDVQLRPTDSVDTAVDLFVKNQVDAVVGWEPVIQAALDSGGKVLLGSDNYRAILDVVVVSTKALATKPAAVQAFLDAWFAAVKLTTDDPQRAGEAVVKSGDTAWTGIAKPSDFADALGLVAQATLGQNAFALREPGLLANRLNEIRSVWTAGGKQLATVDTTKLLDGGLVQKSAAQGNLDSAKAPVNPSFVLTSKIALPQLTPEQIGQTQAVAELPLKQIAFGENSAVLTEQGRKDLLFQVVPVLKQTPGFYLRVDVSVAQLSGDAPQENERLARSRAQAVISFLIGQGIDGNRLIEGYAKPQFPNSPNEAELVQDRRVIFTLVQPGGR